MIMNEDIVLMLTGWKELKRHLDEIPNRDFMDMTVCYLIAQESWENGREAGLDLRTLLDRDLKNRNISNMEELYRTALQNTEELFPAEIHMVADGMYCITNDQHTFGATAMMYPDKLKSVSELIGSDMYVVPSSIHEVICIAPEAVDPADIYDYIQYSNKEYLAPKDVLSSSLYYYEASQQCLTIAYSENSFS